MNCVNLGSLQLKQALDRYKDAIKYLAESKKNPQKLLDLDNWYMQVHDTLSAKEILKIVEWKLSVKTRDKF